LPWAETFHAVANRLLRQHAQMVGLNPSFTLLDREDSADLQCKGFHDEPLKGKLQGQRSVRLNRAYRAIYVEHETGEVELIEVLEVNKHEY
jgi:addiction module RelE/StbE family toxin